MQSFIHSDSTSVQRRFGGTCHNVFFLQVPCIYLRHTHYNTNLVTSFNSSLLLNEASQIYGAYVCWQQSWPSSSSHQNNAIAKHYQECHTGEKKCKLSFTILDRQPDFNNKDELKDVTKFVL